MKFNPEIHCRRSIRLKGHDYSRPGAYFVTICTRERECLFGDVMEGKIQYHTVVGADPRVCPDSMQGAHTGAPLPTIVQWFKTMTTNEYMRRVKKNGWPPLPGKLWQRNYYERIIRNEDALIRTSEYILNNPVRWADDEDNPIRLQTEPDL